MSLFGRYNRGELIIDLVILACEHAFHHCFALKLIVCLSNIEERWFVMILGLGLGLGFSVAVTFIQRHL